MSLLDSVMGNKTLTNLALGKLKTVMIESNYQYIVLSLDPEDGGILLDMYKPGEAEIKEIKPIEETVKIETNEA